MRHISLKPLFMLFILLFAFSAVVVAQETEDNESSLDLVMLYDGSVVEGALSAEQPSFVYVFNANEGDVVTLQMVQTDTLDPFLILLGPVGQLIGTNDDAASDDRSALLADIELPLTGSYFIIATSFDSFASNDLPEEEQGFFLRLEGNTEVLEMDERFRFMAKGLENGEDFTGYINAEEVAFYFVIQASEGDVLDLAVTSTDFDTILYVYGPSGPRIAVNDDIDYENGMTDSQIEGLVIPADGSYLAIVTNPFILYRGIDDSEETAFGDFEISLTLE